MTATMSSPELRRRLNLYREALNAVPNGFAVFHVIRNEEGDPCDFRFIEGNKSFSALTGLSPEKLRAKTLLDLLGRDGQAFLEAFREAALKGRPGHTEHLWKASGKHVHATVFSPRKDLCAAVLQDLENSDSREEGLCGVSNLYLNRDSLTKLPNRFLCNAKLQLSIEKARSEKRKVALIALGLDRFRNINESMGYPAGDSVLRSVVKRLRGAVKAHDTIARLSGTEFMIVVENVGRSSEAAAVAQRLLETFSQPFVVNGNRLYLTASAGISIYPDHGEDAESLIRNADSALCRSKEQGGNTLRFYTQDLTSTALERIVLENALRGALERDEFLLYYQPQVNLETGDVVGSEALIRWKHAEPGVISPGKFIPLAEQTGLIASIGDWVLRKTCEQYKMWEENGINVPAVSVNISGFQFLHGSVVNMVEKVLQETEMDPHCLVLEVTESSLMEHADEAIAAFSALKEHGVRVAIDDFGTGYSSLGALRRLPINTLKIDRSFVCNLPEDKDSVAITKAVLAMASSLRISVVAEGVETEAQAEFLKSIGCCEGQGFLYCHPVPAEEFENYVETAQEVQALYM